MPEMDYVRLGAGIVLNRSDQSGLGSGQTSAVEAPSAKATVLVLGCGTKQDPIGYGLTRRDGSPIERDDLQWITLDGDPSVQPEIVCRLGQDTIPLQTDSVDLVIAQHVLEHIGTQGQTGEWFLFWEEIYRVLKPGGRLQFECPLASSVWAWADPTHTRGITEHVFVYLIQDSYRKPGSAIPRYRVACDWQVEFFKRVPDSTNEEVRQRESESFLRGALIAKKPLRPWWEDHA